MSDLSTSKAAIGGTLPLNATESPWSRVEPLISPAQLAQDHLFGLPLLSAIPDPITKKPARMTEDVLQRYIVRAVSIVEEDAKISIFPTRFSQKLPFDRPEFEALGYFKIPNRPITNLISLSVRPASGQDIFTVPNDWIEVTHLQEGQINIIPINVASLTYTGLTLQGAPGGAFFIQLLGSKYWIPAYWNVEYIAGFQDGNVPRIINEIVGMKAALLVLRDLAATHAQVTSRSLNIDGMGQSIGGPGAEIYTPKLTLLQQDYDKAVKKLKAKYGQTAFVSSL